MKRLYKPLWAALAVATGAAVAGHAGQNTPPIRKTPPPATTPLPAPTIWAWGKAAHGLQGGLCLRNADGRVGSGTLVILDVAARNATRTPIAVEYDDPNEAGSNSSINFIPKGAITRVGIGLDGLGLSAPLTRVLKPGQAVTISANYAFKPMASRTTRRNSPCRNGSFPPASTHCCTHFQYARKATAKCCRPCGSRPEP